MYHFSKKEDSLVQSKVIESSPEKKKLKCFIVIGIALFITVVCGSDAYSVMGYFATYSKHERCLFIDHSK